MVPFLPVGTPYSRILKHWTKTCSLPETPILIINSEAIEKFKKWTQIGLAMSLGNSTHRGSLLRAILNKLFREMMMRKATSPHHTNPRSATLDFWRKTSTINEYRKIQVRKSLL